jgi:UDP-glucose 4-epimerase
MRVLVTGAAGKLGSNLVRRLTERGHQVRALDLADSPTWYRLKPFEPEVVAGDFADPEVARRAVEGVDAVVNLASIGHFARDNAHFFTTDTVGTYNLLDGAVKAGTVGRFVQASSFVSYGPSLYEPVDEHHPQRPNNTLGMTKLTAEVMCETFRAEHKLPTVRLRFTWVHAGLDFLNVPFRFTAILRRARHAASAGTPGASEALARLEELAKEGEERLMVVRGPDGRSWTLHLVDIRDLVSLVEAVLVHPSAVGEAFNVAPPSPISYEAGAPYLAGKLGLPCDDVTMPMSSTTHLSQAKSRLLLGFVPQYDFFRSVDDALRMRGGEDVGVVPL